MVAVRQKVVQEAIVAQEKVEVQVEVALGQHGRAVQAEADPTREVENLAHAVVRNQNLDPHQNPTRSSIQRLLNRYKKYFDINHASSYIFSSKEKRKQKKHSTLE